MTATVGGVRFGALMFAVVLLAACAHTPSRQSAAAQPVATMTVAPPAAADTSSDAVEPAAQPEPAAVPAPPQYADLFDRIRAGFKLDDVESRAVAVQLSWFANNPDYLDRAFGRSELYLYDIVSQLESRHMPLEIALLPVVESAFEPYAYSRARASGLWQFIPDTGSRYGLKQDWWYDGRRDVVESTRAALDYLQSLHDEFNGDWLLAIAAYNCGELNVERAVAYNRAHGRPIDFWSLRLPKETEAYVPKLLAMKRLVAAPEKYGLSISHIPNLPYFERVETYGQIDMKIAAELAGISADELYELNPAFHRWATDPTGPHYLLLPPEKAALFRQNITQLTPEQRCPVASYTVAEHDSVASIARQFNTSVGTIRAMNDMPTGGITIGADLSVPSGEVLLPEKVLRAAALIDSPARRMSRRHHIHVVRRGDSLWAIAHSHHVDVGTLAAMNGIPKGGSLRAGQQLRLVSNDLPVADEPPPARRPAKATRARPVTYIVRAGDTLAEISRVFQVTVTQILSWNGMSSGSHLLPGQRLTIKVLNRQS